MKMKLLRMLCKRFPESCEVALLRFFPERLWFSLVFIVSLSGNKILDQTYTPLLEIFQWNITPLKMRTRKDACHQSREHYCREYGSGI